MFCISRYQIEELFAHAREAAPEECCGVVGGNHEEAKSIYPLRNVAKNPLNAYEAAPEDLFKVQKEMRERGEELLAIYHSHPCSANLTPSKTDVALAFYPNAVYLIIGFEGERNVLKAFRIFESEGRWEEIDYVTTYNRHYLK
jgi:proteasome lid subunit RPN8/RPN11